jgi:hypothetical protein
MCCGSGAIGNCSGGRGNNGLRRKEVHEGPGDEGRRKGPRSREEIRELSNKNIQRLYCYSRCQQRSKRSLEFRTAGDGGCFCLCQRQREGEERTGWVITKDL